MGVLLSAAEFLECLGVGILLGDHESMKIKWIFSHFERIFRGERVTERTKKLSLGRPVCDGKDDIGKCSAEPVFDRSRPINIKFNPTANSNAGGAFAADTAFTSDIHFTSF